MVSHVIAFDFGILFQSVKYRITSICVSLDFKLDFMWKLIDSYIFFIYSIATSYLMILLFWNFSSSSNAIAFFYKYWRWKVYTITMVYLSLFRVFYYVLQWFGQWCDGCGVFCWEEWLYFLQSLMLRYFGF